MSGLIKIKFVGKRKGLEPLKSFTDGNDLVTLPENQSRAFSHKDARAILQHAPQSYKRVIPKSGKRKIA
jgi:hypothetical protein